MDSVLRQFNESREVNKSGTQLRTKLNISADPNPFYLKYEDRKYDGQYFSMYQYRLKVLRERVTKNCEERWDSHFKLKNRTVVKKNKVLDIQANEPCWCVGTIYCEMKYKPNILDEVVNDVYGAPDLVKGYTDVQGSDELMLEDESGRVLLVGDIMKSKPFVSGTVLGVLGMEAEAGTFQVLDICYPSALPQEPFPHKATDNGKIALISGLNANPSSPRLSLKLQMLQEYLTGDMVSPNSVAEIGRLIICGNSMNPAEPDQLAGCLKEIGTFIGNTLQSMPVDLMPGHNDPSDHSLPQQPLHKALFQSTISPFFKNINNDLFSPVTNPMWFRFNDVELLGTSGQNINDLCKYIIPSEKSSGSTPVEVEASSHETPIEPEMTTRMNLIEGCLKWQNIAPTAPDTLWCYPYKDNDPFILKKWPHVFFIGNQPEFAVRDAHLEGGITVKIISLPEFSRTGEMVILDLGTLSTELVTIDV